MFGEKPYLWATVGEDFEEYREWLEERGINTDGIRVIPNEYTASFFVNTDKAHAQIASFYPGAMAYASQLSLEELVDQEPDLVVISPNDPEAMVKYARECQELDIPYIYDPSQQIVRLSGEDLCMGIAGARALFLNEYEFELVQKMTGWGKTEILDCERLSFTVITHGKNGSTITTKQEEIKIPIVPPRTVGDPTGVGDAFRGGFLAGYSRDLELGTCGHMGALAASYCFEHTGTQGHAFTIQEFVDRYRDHFDDGQMERFFCR
jgi:adenosine kinase